MNKRGLTHKMVAATAALVALTWTGIVQAETKIRVLDLDVLMTDTAAMPIVRFPHRPHTEWLDCANCHDHIFLPKAGANPVNMFAILQGNFCGQCHGAVSFPLTQCRRCHNVPRGELQRTSKVQKR